MLKSILYCSAMIIVFAAAGINAAEPTPYDRHWATVAEMLKDRNYGSARELIAQEMRLPTLAQYQQQLAQDDHDCHLLQELKEKVIKRCQEFKSGETLAIGGLKYEFVRFENDAKGEQLVLKFVGSDRENVKPLNTMNAIGIASLLEGTFPPTPNNRYVLGIFHAADRTGDRALARRYLSDAAGHNVDVRRWIVRLDRMEGKLPYEPPKPVAPLPDPIVGNWRVATKIGDKKDTKNWTMNADGTTANGGTWTNRGNGKYTVSGKGGSTAEVEISRDKSTLTGRFTAGGQIRADRQSN